MKNFVTMHKFSLQQDAVSREADRSVASKSRLHLEVKGHEMEQNVVSAQKVVILVMLLK